MGRDDGVGMWKGGGEDECAGGEQKAGAWIGRWEMLETESRRQNEEEQVRCGGMRGGIRRRGGREMTRDGEMGIVRGPPGDWGREEWSKGGGRNEYRWRKRRTGEWVWCRHELRAELEECSSVELERAGN